MNNKRFLLNIILSAWLISVILIGISTSTQAVDTSYQINFKQGTQSLIVSKYNKDKWEKEVDDPSSPDEWFEGDADKLNAKSRNTIRGIDEVTFKTADLWFLIFEDDLSDEALGVLLNQEETINDMYDTKYKGWEVIYAEWEFTDERIKEEADHSNEYFSSLKDPKKYDDILENYNQWVESMNIIFQMSNGTQGMSLSNYTSFEFFWLLILNELIVLPTPVDNYLNAIIDTLNLKHVEVKNNILTIEKSHYSIEISYDSNGVQNNIVVMDSDDRTIYQISSDISFQIWLVIIPIIIILCITGLAYLALKKKKNRK